MVLLLNLNCEFVFQVKLCAKSLFFLSFFLSVVLITSKKPYLSKPKSLCFLELYICIHTVHATMTPLLAATKVGCRGTSGFSFRYSGNGDREVDRTTALCQHFSSVMIHVNGSTVSSIIHLNQTYCKYH